MTCVRNLLYSGFSKNPKSDYWVYVTLQSCIVYIVLPLETLNDEGTRTTL